MTTQSQIDAARELLDDSRGALTDEGFEDRRLALDNASRALTLGLTEVADASLRFATAGLEPRDSERCPACGADAHWPEARKGFGFYDEATGTSVDDFGCPGQPEPEQQPGERGLKTWGRTS